MNWGIIGYGEIAPVFIESLNEFKKERLHAIATRSNAEKARTQHPGCLVYERYEDFYQDPDIDIVYVATTHNYHKDNVIDSLNNGKHVLCEKPLAVNQYEVEAMIQASHKNNRFLMEGMWTRFLPAYRKAAELIHGGAIGELRMIQANFAHKSSWGPERRLLNPKLAGGALLDAGIYPIAITQDFFREEVRNVMSMADMSPTGVDASCVVIIDYHSGRLAQLFSSVRLSTKWSAMLYGTEGWIEIFNFLRCINLNVHKDGKDELVEIPFVSTGFYHEIEATLQDIADGKIENEIMSHSDSLECARMMDRAIKQFK